MNLTILDLFILSAIDRGAGSTYDLQRDAGISLGASTPSLARLTRAKLVSKEEGRSSTNRPRTSFQLTASGKREVRNSWQQLLNDQTITDLDSILRIADMASHYGGDPQRIKSYLRRAGEQRIRMAEQAKLKSEMTPIRPKRLRYSRMRAQCDEQRLKAEGNALMLIGNSFRRVKGEIPGQQSLAKL